MLDTRPESVTLPSPAPAQLGDLLPTMIELINGQLTELDSVCARLQDRLGRVLCQDRVGLDSPSIAQPDAASPLISDLALIERRIVSCRHQLEMITEAVTV